ncbi:BrnA antitoxin family protein [Parasphingorhabdus sp.]|uniref:BrnA antitoxin family protein n=1 Tax=Parasphingorhabdus sp. TaxID=2709688 RepID=UPI0032EF9CC0
MKKESKKLATKMEKELAALDAMRDEDIDLSDVPEVTDWSAAERGKFYRPVKEQVTLRLDADVLHWFKQSGSGYQTRINAALRRFVEEDERKVG